MIKAIVFGVISGILSFFLFVLTARVNGMQFAAGIVFAITSLLFFRLYFRQNLSTKDVVWIILSTVSYYIAVWTTIVGMQINETLTQIWYLPEVFYSLSLGGIIGTFLMLLSFRWTVQYIPIKHILLLAFLGGLLAQSFNFHPEFLRFNFTGDSVNLEPNLFVLYIVWQTGMFVGMYWAVKKSLKRK